MVTIRGARHGHISHPDQMVANMLAGSGKVTLEEVRASSWIDFDIRIPVATQGNRESYHPSIS